MENTKYAGSHIPGIYNNRNFLTLQETDTDEVSFERLDYNGNVYVEMGDSVVELDHDQIKALHAYLGLAVEELGK